MDRINVVISDVAAATGFLGELGVEFPPAPGGWEAHHVNVPAASGFGIELDNSVFAQEWGGVPPGFTGVVVNLRGRGARRRRRAARASRLIRRSLVARAL